MATQKRIRVREPKRNILTEYFAEGVVVKTTRSSDPLRAIQNATGYLIAGKFGDEQHMANLVHITFESGRVITEMILRKDGTLEIPVKYDPRDYVTKGTLHYFRQVQKNARKKQ